MQHTLADLAAQQDELTTMVRGLDDAGWALPSRCEGWSVADVLLHLAQTNEMAIGSASGRFAEAMAALSRDLVAASSVDEGAALMVARDRGAPNADVLARWEAGVAELCAVLASSDPSARVEWVAGTLAVRTLATTRLAETWIHSEDIAHGLGVALEPTERLQPIARLAWRTLPYAFGQAGRSLRGPVAFELTAPDGSTWTFTPDEPATTTIHGPALDLCRVAGRRADAAATELRGEGPDVAPVLELVRTFA